ncbi:hypothetical protein L228DRAFT_267040 [Xylona heveae TC161]|uniref:Uncharacterized protein n=1 Tax=Xylona heveae (strain CBS 132557 / TC161) TaxID=1328760 RepID=A0A165ID58_XYLHT|nr:hypothetical protein L228DRAFT_267040 [Xylona heveae TC161]KZF24731.1 hypothetical protein L228DRAFT_267040 [Xylona heveae TC161]
MVPDDMMRGKTVLFGATLAGAAVFVARRTLRPTPSNINMKAQWSAIQQTDTRIPGSPVPHGRAARQQAMHEQQRREQSSTS